MSRQSLRRSLAITLLGLAIGPLLALGAVLTWYSFHEQQQQSIDLQRETSKRAAQEFTYPIETLQKWLLSAAEIYDLIHLPPVRQNQVISQLRAHSDEAHRNIVTELTLIANNGREVNKVSYIDIITPQALKDRSADEVFIYPTTNNETYYSPVYFDPTTGDPLITTGLPLRDIKTGHIEMVLAAELRLKELWKSLTTVKVGKSGLVYIIDDQDRIITHPNPSLVLRGAKYAPEKPVGFQLNPENEYSSIVSEEFHLGKRKFHLITELPFTEAIGVTINTATTVVAIMVITVIGSVGIGYFIVHRTVTPIESLAATATEICEGNLTRRAEISRDDETALLARAFNSMTERLVETIQDLENTVDHVNHMANYDVLTDLPNRRLLEATLSKKISEAARHRHYGALIFLDLDHFKTINDSLGHPIGDLLLQQVAERLHGEARAEDTVARLGGDEFVVLLPQLSDEIKPASQRAYLVAEKLRQMIAEPYELGENYYRVTASIGIAMLPNAHDNANEILKHADMAMYRSKEKGRNYIHFYHPDMQVFVDERLALEKELHEAIEADHFVLFYQPIVNKHQQVIGLESLIRWQSPIRGLVSPDQFIYLAEETGLIIPIGEWALEKSCRQFKEWQDKHNNSLQYISVNISYRQFHERDFPETVVKVLQETGLKPNELKLEITESILMTDVDDAIRKIRSLKDIGVQFSVDDFGTGYSSLSYLSKLPLDILKIDRSFVSSLPQHKDSAAIVETIISMANNLNLKTIAEGVETESQLLFLDSKGCTAYQGYLFSEPLPEKDIMEFVTSFSSKTTKSASQYS